jgi:hypothetical protein
MTDTKARLQEIEEKIANPKISISEIKGLSEEWERLALSLQGENKKEERILSTKIAEKIGEAIFNSIDRWEKREISPSEIEVTFLYGFFLQIKRLEANQEAIEKSLNESNKIDEDEKQQTIKLIKKNIEKLKKRELILEKLFQEADEKFYSQKKKRDHSDSDLNEPSSEENTEQILNQKITALQNQIEELKKSQDNKPEVQQQITALQKQKEEIQIQLDKLQNEVSSRSTSDNSSEPRENKEGKSFPAWGIILIVFGLLTIAGVIGYFVLERKEKSKLGKNQK